MPTVVVFTTSEPHSLRFLETVARQCRVGGVVQPRPQLIGSRLQRLLRRTARRLHLRPTGLERAARAMGIPCWTANSRGDADVAARIRGLGADVACIAGYPWIMPPAMFQAARLGTLNVHPSLLPRHRGAMPLLWTYIRDDRDAGVTVHWVSDRVDAGDVIFQHAFPLERGRSVEAVQQEIAEHGARLVVQVMDLLDSGGAPRTPQDDRAASRAPVVRPGTRVVDFATWDVERVWHVLAGLATRHQEPLTDERGLTVRYDGAARFRRVEHDRTPGTLTTASRLQLYCRGGVVEWTT